MQVGGCASVVLACIGAVCSSPLLTQYGATQRVLPARLETVQVKFGIMFMIRKLTEQEVKMFATNTSHITTHGVVSGMYPQRIGTFLSFEKLARARIYELVLSDHTEFTGAIDVYRSPETFKVVPIRSDGTIAWIKLGTIYADGEVSHSLVSDVARGKSSVSLLLVPSLQYKNTRVRWTQSGSALKGFALESVMPTPVKRHISDRGGNHIIPRELVVLTGTDHFRIAGKPAVDRGVVSGPSPWAVGVLVSFVLDIAGIYNLVLIKPDTAVGKIAVYRAPETFSEDVVPLVDGLPSWTPIGTLSAQQGGRSNVIHNAAEAVSTVKFLLLPEYRAADTKHVVEVEWTDNFATKTGLILENALRLN